MNPGDRVRVRFAHLGGVRLRPAVVRDVRRTDGVVRSLVVLLTDSNQPAVVSAASVEVIYGR